MGKGGEKVSSKRDLKNASSAAADNSAATSKRPGADNEASYKLSSLSTEELRKWALSYGESEADGDRITLLKTMNPYADGILDKNRPDNLPLAPLPFTLKTIMDAIPKHCYKRSLFISLTYLLSDLLVISCFFYLATLLYSASDDKIPLLARCVLWPIYWYAQGAVMTGVWVLAHECGHQGFSDNEFANNTVGTICHSLLLVPYHSWRITHGKHHANTGSCEHDEVFAPYTRKDMAGHALREAPLAAAMGIVIMLTVGWIPGYLVFNATGPTKYQGKNANHFSPTAVFFKPEDYWLIVQSDLAFFACVGLLMYSIYTFGFSTVAFFYLIPYLVVNYHLVLITYLQHTDVFMPHFRKKEWTWLRGALCTVDRSFGPVLDYTFHHISDTHVCHHLFSSMPFYHAQEATAAIKSVIGKYHMKDDTPIAKALWRSFLACQFIEDDGDVVFYKNIR